VLPFATVNIHERFSHVTVLYILEVNPRWFFVQHSVHVTTYPILPCFVCSGYRWFMEVQISGFTVGLIQGPELPTSNRTLLRMTM
jgi:hypothetical protein